MPRLSLQFVIVLAAFPPEKMSQHITKLEVMVQSYGATWVDNLYLKLLCLGVLLISFTTKLRAKNSSEMESCVTVCYTGDAGLDTRSVTPVMTTARLIAMANDGATN